MGTGTSDTIAFFRALKTTSTGGGGGGGAGAGAFATALPLTTVTVLLSLRIQSFDEKRGISDSVACRFQ